MATAVRTLKTVRPHIPLIKFPARGPVPKYDGATSVPPAATVNATTTPTPASSASASSSKPVGSTPRGSGIDDINLPARYQRKAIAIDEMEFIERGGPA